LRAHREAEGMLQPIYGKCIIFTCLSTLFFSGFSQDHGTQNSWFNQLFAADTLDSYQWLPHRGFFDQFANYQQNTLLNDVSCKNILQGFERKKELLKTLEKNESKMISLQDRISYKIFHWELRRAVAGESFLFHEYRVTQIFGILSNITSLFTSIHSLKSSRDVESYLARLKIIPEYLEQTIELLDYQKSKGIMLPAFAMEKVINIIKKMTPRLITENIFYSHFAKLIETINSKQKSFYLERAQIVIETSVYQAYERLKECCTKILRASHSHHGVWALPDGDRYYEYMLEKHTTVPLSADEIHELGLQEVYKIHKEMRVLLTQEGVVDSRSSVGKLMQIYSRNPDFYYPETAAGRAACLAEFETILARCRRQLSHLFNCKPKKLVHIKAVPLHEEDGMAGAYYARPSIDGVRPGTFFVNLRSMKELPRYEMETLTVHEAEPGHHFQLSLQMEMDIPLQRKLGTYTAFIEGWALYVEKLAYEENFYSSVAAKLGHLQDELLRAARLVVDTGIHKKRWTREQAIAYMKEATGYHQDSIVTEVERYFVWPGQACAYKIGQLKILELRQRARSALGNDFDIREFHDVILTLGAAPLVVLEEVIDLYIHNNLNKQPAGFCQVAS
jgi:uncharacterized protein (DUF885 family)